MDSILNFVKSMIGVDEDYTHYDSDLIAYINLTIFNLSQIGIGSGNIVVRNKEDKWELILGERKDLEAVKTYVYLKVRLLFDPPQHAYLIEAIQREIDQIEWRLNVKIEGGDTDE